MMNTIKAWQCVGCGKLDAPQPCIGVCEDRKVELVYASEHAEALAQRDALAALLRRLACTTPRDGQYERNFCRLRDEARKVLEEIAG